MQPDLKASFLARCYVFPHVSYMGRLHWIWIKRWCKGRIWDRIRK